MNEWTNEFTFERIHEWTNKLIFVKKVICLKSDFLGVKEHLSLLKKKFVLTILVKVFQVSDFYPWQPLCHSRAPFLSLLDLLMGPGPLT